MKKLTAIFMVFLCLILVHTSALADTPNTKFKSFESTSIIKQDGSYWVWGHGQAAPVQIHGLSDVERSIGDHLVMKKDHTVWFWERLYPSGAIKVHSTPALDNLVTVHSRWNSLALDQEGQVYVLATQGKLDPVELEQLAPLSGIDNAKDISYYYTSFQETYEYRWSFLKKDKTVWITNDKFPLEKFRQIQSLNNVLEIAGNSALKEDGTVWSWSNQGSNEPESFIAEPVSKLKNIRTIKSFGNYNIAIDQKEGLWYWGATVTGASDGTTFHKQPVPVKLTTITDVKDAFVIERNLLVLTNGGDLYRTSIDREKMPENPTFERMTTDVQQIKADTRHIIMEKKDGSLWGWGYNRQGQLGCGDFEIMHDTLQRVQKPVSVYIDGTSIPLNHGVIIKDGQSFIPLRSVFEKMGATIKWDALTKTVTISRDEPGKEPIVISINYKSGEVYLNQKSVQLANRPFILVDTSYLPLRFISESLGNKVKWLQDEGKISISSE